MSTIIQTWFYLIDESYENTIYIEKNIYVSLLFKNTKTDIILDIWENTKVDVYGFFSEASPENIIIHQNKNHSSLNVKMLFIENKTHLSSNIISKINAHSSSSNIHIVSMVQENKISINSSLEIEKNNTKVLARLDLENIFLWKNGSIHSLPNLFIKANDVKVSHSSKTHRLDENKLFYLKSRGLDTKTSTSLLLESYFSKLFSCIQMLDKKTFDINQTDFLNLIN